MFCPKCGAPIKEGDVFCASCGARIIIDESSRQGSGPENGYDWREEPIDGEYSFKGAGSFGKSEETIDGEYSFKGAGSSGRSEETIDGEYSFKGAGSSGKSEETIDGVYSFKGERSGKPGYEYKEDAGYGSEKEGCERKRTGLSFIGDIKKLGSSVLVFVGIIVYAVAAILTGIYTVTQTSEITSFFSGYVEEGTAAVSVGLGTIIWVVVGLILAVLMVIAVTFFYASASNKDSSVLDPAGLSMMRVVTIVDFVFACIIMGLGISFMVFMAVAVGQLNRFLGSLSFSGLSLSPAVMVIGAIIAAAVTAAIVIYFIKAIKTQTSLINSIRMEEPCGNISLYLIVVTFIFAGISIMSAVFQFGSVIGVAADLCAAAVHIITAIVLIKFRGIFGVHSMEKSCGEYA